MLVVRTGEVVTKRELFARLWPDTIVEDANLKVMSRLCVDPRIVFSNRSSGPSGFAQRALCCA